MLYSVYFWSTWLALLIGAVALWILSHWQISGWGVVWMVICECVVMFFGMRIIESIINKIKGKRK